MTSFRISLDGTWTFEHRAGEQAPPSLARNAEVPAPCALQPFFPHWQDVRVRQREGTLWQGDWASSFSWLRRAGVFAASPGGPLLDESFDRVLPGLIITGCNLLDFHARVHAGMVVGWVHRPAALVVERGHGKGTLVTSTFRLFRDPAHAPTATKLIDALVHLARGRCRAASGVPGVPNLQGCASSASAPSIRVIRLRTSRPMGAATTWIDAAPARKRGAACPFAAGRPPGRRRQPPSRAGSGAARHGPAVLATSAADG